MAAHVSPRNENVAFIVSADFFATKSLMRKAEAEPLEKAASAQGLPLLPRMAYPKKAGVRREDDEQVIARLEDKNEELLRLREELRASEERCRTLAETATDCIFAVQRDGTIEYINSHGARQFGLSQEELIGKRQWDLFPREIAEANLRIIQGVFETGEPVHEEAKRPYSQREIWQSTWLVPIKTVSGEVRSVLGIARDVTKGKLLEQQLRHSQKMEAIGQLASGVAHDFNNILTVIKGYANFLLSRGNLDAEAVEEMSQVFVAADRASKLTSQLLTLSRRGAMKFQPLDLNQILTQLAKMLRRVITEDIRLEFDYSPSLPAIMADAGMLEQVVLNLAVNARDAMPRGGQLFISTESVEIDEAYAKRHAEARPGPHACLVIRDTGCGIPGDILPHVFEPFFTTKDPEHGTGLGLATVYGITKQHNGWIEVASEIGVGTVFKVFLPGNPELVVASAKEFAPARVRGGDETILVVEDESELRQVTAEILSRYGYGVLQAASGLEALSIWQHAQCEIDLLLTDLILPDGLTGWELSRKLQQQRPHLGVIYTTGYSLDLVEHKLALPPEGQILQKPFTPAMLGQAVRDCLDAGHKAIPPHELAMRDHELCEQCGDPMT